MLLYRKTNFFFLNPQDVKDMKMHKTVLSSDCFLPSTHIFCASDVCLCAWPCVCDVAMCVAVYRQGGVVCGVVCRHTFILQGSSAYRPWLCYDIKPIWCRWSMHNMKNHIKLLYNNIRLLRFLLDSFADFFCCSQNCNIVKSIFKVLWLICK